MFIILVNNCREMWSRWSHLLHPLTTLTPDKVKFKWIEIEKNAFEDIKHIVSCDALFAYTDFNKYFDIHNYDRDYQLETVISKEVKSIYFYIFNITVSQTTYTVMEKLFLIKVKTLE